jgi:hypothetical protein
MKHVKPALRARVEKYLNEEQGMAGETAMEHAA